VLPNLNAEDKSVMEKLLKDGKIKHKYAKRIQTVLKRAEAQARSRISLESHGKRSAVLSTDITNTEWILY
jgi:hypothetical protein